MNGVQIIDLRHQEKYKICQIIAKAGFKTIIKDHYVQLEDTTSKDADKYSDLTFKSLIEAAKAIQPYVANKYLLIA